MEEGHANFRDRDELVSRETDSQQHLYAVEHSVYVDPIVNEQAVVMRFIELVDKVFLVELGETRGIEEVAAVDDYELGHPRPEIMVLKRKIRCSESGNPLETFLPLVAARTNCVLQPEATEGVRYFGSRISRLPDQLSS